FVGGDALKPTEWRDHAQQKMQFSVFGDERLLEDDGLFRVEARGEVVRDNFDGVLRDGRSVRVIAGERVPGGGEVETFVGRKWRVASGEWRANPFGCGNDLVLQADPVFERAEIMADVEFSGRPHAGDNSPFVGYQDSFALVASSCRF